MRPRFSLLIPCHTQLQLHQWWRWVGGGYTEYQERDRGLLLCLLEPFRACVQRGKHPRLSCFFWGGFFEPKLWKKHVWDRWGFFRRIFFFKVQVRAELVPSVQCTASLRISNCYFFGYLPCVQVGFIRVFSVSLDGELRQFQTLWDSMLQSRLSRVSYRIQTPLPFPPNT